MSVSIDEPVKVAAVFGGKNKIQPRWFVWEGKKYSVKEVHFVWTEVVGRARVHHFSVSDGVNVYDLLYNTESMLWTLGAVDDGEY